MLNIALILLASFFFLYTFAFLTVTPDRDYKNTPGWNVAMFSWFLFMLIVGYFVFQVKS